MDEELAQRVVELAARAPSVHNTQPWRFVATATGLDLRADRTRQLTALDPTGRQLTISCGAALGVARLAVAALGHTCTVEPLPAGNDVDHLARLTIGSPAPAGRDELALVREIGRRRTVRERFDTVPLRPEARTALDREAAHHGAALWWVDTESDRVALAVLTDRAERVQRSDRAIRAELNRWRRTDDTAADGISAAVMPELPTGLRASDVPLRDFGSTRDTAGDGADPQHLPLPAERPDLVVLCTRHDGPIDWLRAGQALARVLLRATELGLAASPVGQALDLPWTRRRLRLELGLGDHPQVVLRMGHARLAGSHSPRRPLDEILEIRR